MKCFASLLVLAAGASAVIVPRDLATVIDIMTPILDGLHNYAHVLDSYNTTLDGKALEHGGAVMLRKIANATNLASQMPPLNLTEAYGFQTLSDELNAAGDVVIYDLGNMTARFEAGRECKYIVPHVINLAAKVDNLMKTVASKFPSSGQSKDAGTITHFEVGFAASNAALASCNDKSTQTTSHRCKHAVRAD
ncbi:hypothetical protein P8C59_009065 [Phyllachora maydis]|uniref:Cell wall galactomannoprotein n=1 Tax=Phyllachora maydis TaxID=1825666 RepID=A0AAD9MHU1_9PEZI|nr:hypothetical protein P8C59_009065 [Phyllachora maydis]